MMLNGGIELKALDDQMQQLEQANTRITDAMTLAESRGQNVAPSLYGEMSENVLSQIQNLSAQNA